eukprot:gene24284-26030_t
MKATFACEWKHNDEKKNIDKKYDVTSDLGKKVKFSLAGRKDSGGQPIPKVAAPDPWKKDVPQVVGETDNKELDWKEPDAQFPNSMDGNNGDKKKVRIHGIKLGSEFVATPYWRRQLDTRDNKELFLETVLGWKEKKLGADSKASDLDSALDYAVDQVDPVVRRPEAGKTVGDHGGARVTPRIKLEPSYAPVDGRKTAVAGPSDKEMEMKIKALVPLQEKQDAQYIKDTEQASQKIIEYAEEWLNNKE